METEYITIVKPNKRTLWLKRFLKEMGLKKEKHIVYYKNQNIIYLSKNPWLHSQSKNVNIIYY